MSALPTRFRWSNFGLSCLDLLALTGAAIAQPLLDEFGRAPDFFIQHGTRRWELVAFALTLAVVPPLLIATLELGVAAVAGEVSRRHVHRAALATLVGLFAIRALRSAIGWSGSLLFTGAFAVALIFVLLHRAISAVRQWLRFASILPAIAVATFLGISPTGDLLTLGGAHAAAHVTSAKQLSVVVIAFDEFPVLSLLGADGQIDPVRFPNFAALAREARWFRNTTSVGTHTFFANPAILTGRYPHADPAGPTYGTYPDTLFRLLGGTFPINASEVTTRLCAASYCHPPAPVARSRSHATRPRSPHDGLGTLVAKAGQEYRQLVALHDSTRVAEADMGEQVRAVPRSTTSTTHRVAAAGIEPWHDPNLSDKQARAAIQALMPVNQPTRLGNWLGAIRGGTAPVVHYIHLLVPHYPWHLTGAGVQYRLPPDNAEGLLGNSRLHWGPDPEAAALGHRRHLLQVEYVDNLLGEVVAHLKRVGIWDHSIFVVTADHGAGFTAGHDLRELDAGNREDILGVPLFVHAPGVTPGLDDRLAQTVDVVPTIADLLGVRIPWHVDGRSLANDPRPRAASHLVGFGHDFSPNVEPRMVDVGDHLQRTLAIAARRGRYRREPHRDRSVLQTGPRGRLIGRAIRDFTIATGSRRRATLGYVDRAEFDAIDPNQAVPLYIVGDLPGSEPGDVVVVAVNGTIAGTAAILDVGDRRRPFGLLCDPTLLHAGHNAVAFYAVDLHGRLTPVDVS